MAVALDEGSWSEVLQTGARGDERLAAALCAGVRVLGREESQRWDGGTEAMSTQLERRDIGPAVDMFRMT